MRWLIALFVAMGIAAPIAQISRASISADAVKRRLVGNWKLVKYEIFDERGTARPGGFDTGRLMYDEQGEMAAHIMRSGRPPEAPATETARAAAYQSYFAKYTDQTLKVIGSTERSPTDFIVQTQLIDPGSSQPPAEVDFRVRTDTGKPVLVDVAYQGIWLSLEQRDQFVSFLGQNNGNVRTLIGHLSELAVNLGKPSN